MSSSALVDALRNARLVTYQTTVNREGDDVVDCRDLGEWEMPQGEEDDGDYDWMVPTDDTLNKVDKIAKELGWSFCVGEKNWITFHFKKGE